MRYPVNVEEKGNAPCTNDATWRTSYTKRVFPPWNIIIMGSGVILVSPLGTGNKDYTTIDILSVIRDLETKLLYLNNLEPLGSGDNP